MGLSIGLDSFMDAAILELPQKPTAASAVGWCGGRCFEVYVDNLRNGEKENEPWLPPPVAKVCVSPHK